MINIGVDITNFMTWWIQQVINIISQCFNILENIEFMGTNLLSIIATIIVIGIALPVLLTIPKGITTKGERVINNVERNYKK